eukprot:3965885-Karenia_brevis.AAC.1
MAIKQYGLGVTHATIWSDSQIVVNGYSKGKTHTLQPMLATGWEEIWEQADAILDRGTRVQIKKVNAHTSDEALATKELQYWNWQADWFAEMGAEACQLTESEIRPIMKKDSVLWHLQSRMVAAVQTLPSRKGHQIDTKGSRQCCYMCGQDWGKGRQEVGGQRPGPTIWGQPQQNRPWLVPQGRNLQWGKHSIIHEGQAGHKLQWYQG